MLFRINGSFTIRADNYCFMLCQDKGMTKFPKGIVAPYHKPIRYCCHFFELARSLEIEGIQAANEIIEAMREEFQILSSLTKLEWEFGKYDILGTSIKSDKDCYTAKFGSYTTYHRTPGRALFFAWVQYFKNDRRFGASEKDSYGFCEISEIVSAMREFKDQICKDAGADFSLEAEYPKHLRLIES